MKKIVTTLITAILIAITGFQPIYADNSTELTINDYNVAIQKEAKKYGVDVWVNDYDALGKITQEKIDTAIENVKLFATTVHTETNDQITSPQQISRASSTRKRTGYFDIVAAPGSATINVDITATINTSSNKVTTISKKSAYQSGVAFFFSSWTTKSISTQMNTPNNGYVKAIVTGYAVFNYGATSYASNMTGSCLIDFR